MLGGPGDQVEEPPLGRSRREPEIPGRAEGHVHRRKRDLNEVERTLLLEAPGPEGLGDPGPEAGSFGVAERGVVGEAQPLEHGQIDVRVDPQVVKALTAHRSPELLEKPLFALEAVRVLDGRVTAVETDFGAARPQDLDEAGAKPVIGLRRRAVGRVVVPREQEEGRADVASGLEAKNPLEAPVRIGPPELVERDRRQRPRLAERRGGLDPPARGASAGPPSPARRAASSAMACRRRA